MPPADGLPIESSVDRDMDVSPKRLRPVVHLELHTADRAAAGAFYDRLLGWRPEQIAGRWGGYVALELGGSVGGGIVECGTEPPLWLPYVEVAQLDEQIERARQFGARVLLEPREGPTGWRSVVSTTHGGQIAFWQAKR